MQIAHHQICQTCLVWHDRPVLHILRETPTSVPPLLIRGQDTRAVFVDRILAPIVSIHLKQSLLRVIPAPPYRDDMGIGGCVQTCSWLGLIVKHWPKTNLHGGSMQTTFFTGRPACRGSWYVGQINPYVPGGKAILVYNQNHLCKLPSIYQGL